MNGNTPIDQRRRPWRDLRISVMDRCNFRCPYCMPSSVYHDGFAFMEPKDRLGFDEIERVARIAAQLGVTKLRLTGGEPLLRPALPNLVQRLAAIEGIDDVALTTNGVLLDRHLETLHRAGLTRLTISLDSLDPRIFSVMNGGKDLFDQVLSNLDAAIRQGFPGGIKINVVVQKDINESSVIPIIDRFRFTEVIVRFIEYMDVGTRNCWSLEEVVPSAILLDRIAARWPIEPLAPLYEGEVARRYRFTDGGGEIGFISSVTAPFCGDCSRARLSSEGKLYTCLFASQGTDLRPALMSPEDAPLTALLGQIWQERTDRYSEERSQQNSSRPDDRIEMYYIGG